MLGSSWVAYFVISHGWGEGFYISGIGERKLIAGEEGFEAIRAEPGSSAYVMITRLYNGFE